VKGLFEDVENGREVESFFEVGGREKENVGHKRAALD
jgi:hypothetical protein